MSARAAAVLEEEAATGLAKFPYRCGAGQGIQHFRRKVIQSCLRKTLKNV